VTALTLAGCTSKPGSAHPSGSRSPTGLAASPVKDQHISIVNFAFQPKLFTIRAGNRIIWTQTSTTVHTVTSGTAGQDPKTKALKAVPDGMFSSGDLKQGASFPVTFNQPGTYSYFCSHHPDRMVGTIIVQ
jgi:plastocyanin